MKYELCRLNAIGRVNETLTFPTKAKPVVDVTDKDKASRYWFDNVTSLPWYDCDREHLIAVLVNTKMKAVGFSLISIGSLNESIAHPREIFRAAIISAAFGFILIHNHPTGDTSPSNADSSLTHRLVKCAELLQIRLVDHIIVGREAGDCPFSFREAEII